MEKSHPDVSYTHIHTHKSIFSVRFVKEQTDNFDMRENEFIRGIHIVHLWSSVLFYLNARQGIWNPTEISLVDGIGAANRRCDTTARTHSSV